MEKRTYVAGQNRPKVGKFSRVIAVEQLKDFVPKKNSEQLSELKEQQCSWCQACNRLCTDGGARSCPVAKIFERRYKAYKAEEEGAETRKEFNTIMKKAAAEARKKAEPNPFATKGRGANPTTVAGKAQYLVNEAFALRDEVNEEERNHLNVAIALLDSRNFGDLKDYMTRMGYFKRGVKKVSPLNEINRKICLFLKEVF